MANVWVHFMLLPKFAGKPLLALFFISCPCYPCGLLLAKASQVTVCGVRDHDPDLDLDRDLDPDLDRDHDPVEGGASLLLFVCFRLSGRLVKNNLAISGSRRVLPQAYQDNDDNQVRPFFFCWFPAWLLVWFFFVLSHPGLLSSFLFLFFVTPPPDLRYRPDVIGACLCCCRCSPVVRRGERDYPVHSRGTVEGDLRLLRYVVAASGRGDGRPGLHRV